MKKFGILILLMSMAVFAHAQSTSIGLRAGLNGANIVGKDVSNNKIKLGPNFGAFLTYSVMENLAFTGEVNFDSKGSKYDGNPNMTLNLDYLNVPVYANYIFGTSESKMRPKIFAGPSFGFLMNAKAKRSGSSSVDVKKLYESFDLGIMGGIGLHAKMGDNNWLIFDIRYNAGLSNLSKDSNVKSKNGVFSFNVGYSFPLGE